GGSVMEGRTLLSLRSLGRQACRRPQSECDELGRSPYEDRIASAVCNRLTGIHLTTPHDNPGRALAGRCDCSGLGYRSADKLRCPAFVPVDVIYVDDLGEASEEPDTGQRPPAGSSRWRVVGFANGSQEGARRPDGSSQMVATGQTVGEGPRPYDRAGNIECHS